MLAIKHFIWMLCGSGTSPPDQEELYSMEVDLALNILLKYCKDNRIPT